MKTGGAPSGEPAAGYPSACAYDACLQGNLMCRRVVGVVRVAGRMGQDNVRLARPILRDQAVEQFVREAKRVVAGVEELHLGAEERRGLLRLRSPDLLDAIEHHPRLLPGALTLTALAE